MDRAKEWFYEQKGLNACAIITFGTEKYKGATKMILRATDYTTSEQIDIADKINNAIGSKENSLVGKSIIKAGDVFLHKLDNKEFDEMLNKGNVLEYKDLVCKIRNLEGGITRIGSHPAGIIVSDLDIDREIGLITIKGSDGEAISVSQLNMKEVEALGYVKADALGLKTIGVINKTYGYLGIERPMPHEIDLEDDKVWNNMMSSPVGIFQFENEIAHSRLCSSLRNIKGAKRIDTMALASGIIRPSGDSIREDYISGKPYDNGHWAINELFKNNNFYCVYQEDIMLFVKEFCGYTDQEADSVRRAIGKKSNKEVFNGIVSEIKDRFISCFGVKYNVSESECEELIKGFLKIVDDASSYGFSYNHSIAYSLTGYMCAYLRTYYTKEFITANLNIFKADNDKVRKIYEYIKSDTNIELRRPVFGKAKMEFAFDKNENIIYDGLYSLKGLKKNTEEELEKINDIKFDSFLDMLIYIKENKISLGASTMDILVKMDFFTEFGGQEYLLKILDATFGTKSKIKWRKIKDMNKVYTALRSFAEMTPNTDSNEYVKAINEVKYKGATDRNVDDYIYYIFKIDKPYSKYIVDAFDFARSEMVVFKMDKKSMLDENGNQLIKKESVVRINNMLVKPKNVLVDGKWKKSKETENVVVNFDIIDIK